MIFLLVPIKLLSHRSRSFSTTRVCFSGGKPVGHARTILNMHNKIPFNPNPNHLSSSPSNPSPINPYSKLPTLDSKYIF